MRLRSKHQNSRLTSSRGQFHIWCKEHAQVTILLSYSQDFFHCFPLSEPWFSSFFFFSLNKYYGIKGVKEKLPTGNLFNTAGQALFETAAMRREADALARRRGVGGRRAG